MIERKIERVNERESGRKMARIGDRATQCLCAVSVVGRMAWLWSGSSGCIVAGRQPVDALHKSTISRCRTRAHVSPGAPPRASGRISQRRYLACLVGAGWKLV